MSSARNHRATEIVTENRAIDSSKRRRYIAGWRKACSANSIRQLWVQHASANDYHDEHGERREPDTVNADQLVGLWEYAGVWDAARAVPVMAPYGAGESMLREFLFFNVDGTFFYAKYPRDETLFYDPDTKRLVCERFDGVLLRGTWRLEENRLIESARERGEVSERPQEFELDALDDERLVVREPTRCPGQFLNAVYDRRDIEAFPAPPLPDDDVGAFASADEAGIEALLSSGQRNSAHRLAQRCVRRSERLDGAGHPNTAACLCTLGACLLGLDESKAAVGVMERALHIYEEQFGPRALATANALNNLSPAYRAERDLRAAIDAAIKAVAIRSAALGPDDPSTATSIQNLGLALSGLGRVRDALHCYSRAASIHAAADGPTSARARSVLRDAEQLVSAIAGDPRFVHEPLPQPGSPERDTLALQEIVAACEAMLVADVESDLFALANGRAEHKESYILLMSAIRQQQRTIAANSSDPGVRRLRLGDAQRRLRVAVQAPTGTLRAVLKRIDRSTLGPIASATLQHVFPNFTGDIEAAQRRDEALRSFGIDPHSTPTFTEQKRRNAEAQGFTVKSVGKQFRRYSGEGNLPAQRYSSVCIDSSGDDGRTLCRELFEYTDPRVPGFVFVGDTEDTELMQALMTVGMQRPRVPGIFVFLVPPAEDERTSAYRHFFGPVLSTLYGAYDVAREKWDGLSVVFIPTTLQDVEVDDVIDIRQPATQEWLYRFFRNGDGAVWVKSAAKAIRGFAGMLPSLVYPEYGGSGVTKSLGSWMRSAGVAGLVFPSARSDASIQVDGRGALQAFHGWAFVDYRGIDMVPDLLVHADHNDWYDFVAGRQAAPSLRQEGGSWALQGAEARYRQARRFMLDLPRTKVRF